VHVVILCRTVIGLVFIVPGVGKARDMSQFKQTVRDFHLLLSAISGMAAILLLCGECAVVLLALPGGALLRGSFILAKRRLHALRPGWLYRVFAWSKMPGRGSEHLNGSGRRWEQAYLCCSLHGSERL
jgi:hypothetical protein